MVTLATIAGTIWLYIIVPKGFFPDGRYRLRASASPKRKTDIAFPAMVAASAQGGRHRARRSGSRLRQFHGRSAAVRIRSAIAGACWLRSSRATSATACRDDPGAAAPERPMSCRASQIFFQPIQNINLGGRLEQEPVSIHAAIQRHRRRSIASRRNCATRSRKIPGLLDVTTDLYVKNPQVTVEVDREKAAVYGVTVDQVRQELYNAFGIASGRDHLHAGERLSGHSRDQAGIPARARTISTRIYLKTTERHDRAAVGGDAFRANGRSIAGQSPGPAAGGDDLVQSCAGLLARPGGRCDHQARARRAPAGDHHHRLPGHGAGLPGLACAGRAS